jgi:DNA polymerase-3 subunit epsilon
LEVGYIRCSGNFIIDMSSLLIFQDEKFLTEDTQKISSFNIKNVLEFGYSEEAVLKRLNKVMESVDYIIAYNGRSYDKLVYEATCKRLGLKPVDKLWVDPMLDIDFGDNVHSRKLVYVAADHNFLNPFPHRALTDVLTMLMVYFQYDEEKILINARAETVTIYAVNLPFSRKEEAKSRGYKWDVDAKIWVLKIRNLDDNVEKEVSECGFNTKVVPNVSTI